MSDVAETLRHSDLASPQRVASPFEFWPAPLFYAPVAAYWAWQALRYRSITLPSIANPLMEFGGLCGESKIDLFESMSAEGRKWLAPYVSIERGPPAELAGDLARLLDLAEEAGLAFPLVAKPDIGCHGAGVQLVHDAEELRRYLAAFPSGARVLLQFLVKSEGEAGIFYVRRPAERTGQDLLHDPQILPPGHRRRHLDPEEADPGGSARRPCAASLSRPPCGTAQLGAGPGRARAPRLRRQSPARERPSATGAI